MASRDKKIKECKPIALRLRRRPIIKWKDDVKQDLKVTNISHWKKKTT
jgi:hypothetical protein